MAEILLARVSHAWLIIHVKSFLLRPTRLPVTSVTDGRTDRRTDGQAWQ